MPPRRAALILLVGRPGPQGRQTPRRWHESRSHCDVAKRRPPRLRTFSYGGCERYFLTMCCRNRRRYFEHFAVVERSRLELLHTAERRRFAVLAYTFMPDHLHTLVEGGSDDADFCGFVAVLRRRVTIATRFLCPGGLWQDGYFERVLREDEDSTASIDYILDNPIRAGLVARAVDYPFSWSCTLEHNPRP